MELLFVPAAEEDRLSGKYQGGGAADRAIKHFTFAPTLCKVGKRLLLCLKSESVLISTTTRPGWAATESGRFLPPLPPVRDYVSREARTARYRRVARLLCLMRAGVPPMVMENRSDHVTTVPIDGEAVLQRAEGNRQTHLSEANDADVHTHNFVLLFDKGTRGRDTSGVYSM